MNHRRFNENLISASFIEIALGTGNVYYDENEKYTDEQFRELSRKNGNIRYFFIRISLIVRQRMTRDRKATGRHRCLYISPWGGWGGWRGRGGMLQFGCFLLPSISTSWLRWVLRIMLVTKNTTMVMITLIFNAKLLKDLSFSSVRNIGDITSITVHRVGHLFYLLINLFIIDD